MSHRPLHILFAAAFVSACLVVSAYAEGSITFADDALPVLRREPELLKFVQQSLDVAPGGWGVRLGRDFGADVGKRIPPFSFEARPKGQKGPYTLLLVINDPETGMVSGDHSSTTVSIEILHLKPKKP